MDSYALEKMLYIVLYLLLGVAWAYYIKDHPFSKDAKPIPPEIWPLVVVVAMILWPYFVCARIFFLIRRAAGIKDS